MIVINYNIAHRVYTYFICLYDIFDTYIYIISIYLYCVCVHTVHCTCIRFGSSHEGPVYPELAFPAGGETNFPRTDGLPQPEDFSDCSRGISVHPKCLCQNCWLTGPAGREGCVYMCVCVCYDLRRKATKWHQHTNALRDKSHSKLVHGRLLSIKDQI